MWFISACVFESDSASVTDSFSEVYIGKSFVSKGSLLGFFLLPTVGPESPVCDRILCLWHPSPPPSSHCSSWWCHKWRIMILAGETDELGRNKDLLCLQLSLVMGRWGVGSEALSLNWHSPQWAEPSPYRTSWRQYGVADFDNSPSTTPVPHAPSSFNV